MAAHLLEGPDAGGAVLFMTVCRQHETVGLAPWHTLLLTLPCCSPCLPRHPIYTAGTLQREGPRGFTLLHAAVMGGATAALPLLVADGAPLNAQADFSSSRLAGFLRHFGFHHYCEDLDIRITALALAVR